MNRFESYTKEIGYNPITSYWDEFSIAEKTGREEITELYRQKIEECSNDYRILTELAMVLNQKLWESFENKNLGAAKLYEKLWNRTVAYVFDTLEESELNYYIKTTN